MTDLILAVPAYLRYVLRSKPKPEQRQLMRSFGIYFTGSATIVEERASEPDLVPPEAQGPKVMEEIPGPQQEARNALQTRQGFLGRNGFFTSMIDRESG